MQSPVHYSLHSRVERSVVVATLLIITTIFALQWFSLTALAATSLSEVGQESRDASIQSVGSASVVVERPSLLALLLNERVITVSFALAMLMWCVALALTIAPRVWNRRPKKTRVARSHVHGAQGPLATPEEQLVSKLLSDEGIKDSNLAQSPGSAASELLPGSTEPTEPTEAQQSTLSSLDEQKPRARVQTFSLEQDEVLAREADSQADTAQDQADEGKEPGSVIEIFAVPGSGEPDAVVAQHAEESVKENSAAPGDGKTDAVVAQHAEESKGDLSGISDSDEAENVQASLTSIFEEEDPTDPERAVLIHTLSSELVDIDVHHLAQGCQNIVDQLRLQTRP